MGVTAHASFASLADRPSLLVLQLLELKELDLSENYLPDLACLAGLYCLQTLLVPLNTLRTVGPLR